MATSYRLPTSTPKNDTGVRPTTGMGSPSGLTVRPIQGSPPDPGIAAKVVFGDVPQIAELDR